MFVCCDTVFRAGMAGFNAKAQRGQGAKIFQTTAVGLRSAGFQTCCVADFQVGETNGSHPGSGFGNPRHSRLGSPRYFDCGGSRVLMSGAHFTFESGISVEP
jgi:arylsulfatase A-like enzyme